MQLCKSYEDDGHAKTSFANRSIVGLHDHRFQPIYLSKPIIPKHQVFLRLHGDVNRCTVEFRRASFLLADGTILALALVESKFKLWQLIKPTWQTPNALDHLVNGKKE